MKELDLHPGDLFATRNPQALGRGINAIQTWWSKDGQAEYSHTGVITDNLGNTFEALWTLKRGNIYKYIGEKVCIARYADASEQEKINVLDKLIKEHEGQLYPGWRIPLNIIPPLARYISFKGKFNVCSEWTAKYLYCLFLEKGAILDQYGYKWPRHSHFCGTNPDMLSDEWHRWRQYEIIFEGILEAP